VQRGISYESLKGADDARLLQRWPGRMRQLRAETAGRGLDPNVWFGNVERVTSERVGRETVQYVGNIYKYYVAYTLVMDLSQARDAAAESVKTGR
jgi:membrane-bound lytic murein transglycosylase MltF